MPHYIFSAQGEALAQCNYAPDRKDLLRRKQTSVFSRDNFSLERIHCVKGIIVHKPKSIEELVEEKHKEKSDVDGLIDHYTRKQFRVLLEQHGLLDENLKSLWAKRDRLAKEEDELARQIGQREEARTHNIKKEVLHEREYR